MPKALLNIPVPQLMQVDCPDSGWYLPVSHSSQFIDPFIPEKVPVPHFVHATEPCKRE
jgi:hypothetical protein